jgi:hypothetical protein
VSLLSDSAGSPPIILPVKAGKEGRAVHHDSRRFGPLFGWDGGNSFEIKLWNADMMDSSSCHLAGTTFPALWPGPSYHPFLSGKWFFEVEEMEVYAVRK